MTRATAVHNRARTAVIFYIQKHLECAKNALEPPLLLERKYENPDYQNWRTTLA